MNQKKQLLSYTIEKFIAQRPGLDPRDYDDESGYRAASRSITKAGYNARELLRRVNSVDEIGPDDIVSASKVAFSGRLEITETPTGYKIGYCVGQYFPTEYRNAVCSVLATALRTHYRQTMPPVKAWRVDSYAVYTDGRRYSEQSPIFTDEASAEKYKADKGGDSYGLVVELYTDRMLTAGECIRDRAARDFSRAIFRDYFN